MTKSVPNCTHMDDKEIFEMNENSNRSFGQTLNEAPTEEVRLENFSINTLHAWPSVCLCVYM